jgi:hypothetical protein
MIWMLRATRKSDGLVREFVANHQRDIDTSQVPCQTRTEALETMKKFSAYNELWQYELLPPQGEPVHERGNWFFIPSEEPFIAGDVTLRYVYQPSTERYAYLNLDNDTIISDEEAFTVLGNTKGDHK